ncbi:MAG: hypothetical protein F6K11_01185 [Leptolyngbya sp. SIO3F4]|nr:hypothetical protein [Leptolyngbya sp. SIO3F4]
MLARIELPPNAANFGALSECINHDNKLGDLEITGKYLSEQYAKLTKNEDVGFRINYLDRCADFAGFKGLQDYLRAWQRLHAYFQVNTQGREWQIIVPDSLADTINQYVSRHSFPGQGEPLPVFTYDADRVPSETAVTPLLDAGKAGVWWIARAYYKSDYRSTLEHTLRNVLSHGAILPVWSQPEANESLPEFSHLPFERLVRDPKDMALLVQFLRSFPDTLAPSSSQKKKQLWRDVHVQGSGTVVLGNVTIGDVENMSQRDMYIYKNKE